MSEHGFELSVSPAGSLPARILASLLAWRAGLPPVASWALAGLLAGLLGLYFVSAEGEPGNVLFACAITLCVGVALTLASRRVLFAAVATAALVIVVRTASLMKQATSEVLLHAYDVVSLATSWSELARFWVGHREHALALLGAMAAMAVLGSVAWAVDGTRVRRAHAAVAMLLAVDLAVFGAVARGERRHTEIYFEADYVSFFYASWAETLATLWRGHLIEASAPKPQDGFAVPGECKPASKPPHIILIHQESVVPPGHFPSLEYDSSLDAMFVSADRVQRKLRVETFGGASWLTEFSVLTGLSSRSFHGMQQFVQLFTAGRLADTLPRALARCGYRSVMFYPMLRSFVNSGKFFQQAGFEVRDAKDQGAKLPNERDRFYYANALAELDTHLKSSAAPLFLYVETMATHGGYDYAYMPEVNVPGGGPGTHPEVHEYLRRLGMARIDYAELRRELARRFPRQSFLIVHYGDHQPTAVRMLHGFGEMTSVEDVMRTAGPAQLTTYYALDAIGYRLPAIAAPDSIDVPYLGTVLLEAAGLPLSETHRERKRLMLRCQGLYFGCPEREAILAFHRRLIDGGLLDAR